MQSTTLKGISFHFTLASLRPQNKSLINLVEAVRVREGMAVSLPLSVLAINGQQNWWSLKPEEDKVGEEKDEKGRKVKSCEDYGRSE